MRCSLFGKLAAKRDFIAVAAPREFLNAWEPWMQSCVAASLDDLRANWQQAYLTAPIWRFWLGADICGATVVGALMSSLDGVGRYYPLTLFAFAEPGSAFAPPDIEAYDPWFTLAEDFLLSTLDKDRTFEAITGALDQVAAPAPSSTRLRGGMSVPNDGTVAATVGEESFSACFGALRVANHASIYAAASFWWTAGGGGYPASALCCRRMPEPFLFTSMLTGLASPAAV
jgi:type VI secretion system protein ImpM